MEQMGGQAEVGVAQIEVILAFLPIFEKPGFQFGEWVHRKGQVPFYAESQAVRDFHQSLYQQGFIVEFDWVIWAEELERYRSESGALQGADLLTLRKIITAHARKDRFSEGHFAGELQGGHLLAVLRRLAAIRDEMAAAL
jgi:hypothetical protein